VTVGIERQYIPRLGPDDEPTPAETATAHDEPATGRRPLAAAD